MNNKKTISISLTQETIDKLNRIADFKKISNSRLIEHLIDETKEVSAKNLFSFMGDKSWLNKNKTSEIIAAEFLQELANTSKGIEEVGKMIAKSLLKGGDNEK